MLAAEARRSPTCVINVAVSRATAIVTAGVTASGMRFGVAVKTDKAKIISSVTRSEISLFTSNPLLV